MIKELQEIKVIRKKFGLTQAELAKESGVSQSLIAKIESGRLDPSFSFAKKIFSVLDNLHEKSELRADQIMNNQIIFVRPEDKISIATEKMKKNEISQMPVIENGKSVGLVSEGIILDCIMNGKKDYTIKEIMADSPPLVARNASIEIITSMLRFFPLILVGDKGKIIGLIVKSDILAKL